VVVVVTGTVEAIAEIGETVVDHLVKIAMPVTTVLLANVSTVRIVPSVDHVRTTSPWAPIASRWVSVTRWSLARSWEHLPMKAASTETTSERSRSFQITPSWNFPPTLAVMYLADSKERVLVGNSLSFVLTVLDLHAVKNAAIDLHANLVTKAEE
jgi:hypothetical protein